MAQLVWSSIARDDLRTLISYIKADSPGYARTFGLHIQQRVEQLRQFPESGRKVPEDRRVFTERSSLGTTESSIGSMKTS